MVGKIKILLVCALTAAGFSARAQGAPEFIWDSYQGFLSAAECVPDKAESADIQVSTSETRLLNSDRNAWLMLRAGTLVKAKEGAKNRKVDGKIYKPIRLVGVPREHELLNSQDYALKGISMAYLLESEFSTIDNYEIMITSELTMEKIATVTKVGNLALDLKGSVWKPSRENGQFVYFKCGDKKFYAFDVYAPGASYASARVGVDKDATRIFNNIDTRRVTAMPSKPVEAAPVVEAKPTVVTEAPAAQVTPPPAKVAPTPMPYEARARAEAAYKAQIAVCSAFETAIVRKDETEDPDQHFEVPWGTTMIPFPEGTFTPRFIELKGTKYEYSRVQFPGLSDASQRIGWIAKVYIKTRGECPNKPVSEAENEGARAAIVGGNFRGATCLRGDTNPLKCMICAIHWEASLESYAGMVAVGQVIMKRTKTEGYPGTVCRVAYQKGQFVGLKSGKVITKDKTVYDRLHRAAQEAIRLGPGKYLGFRTCSYSRKGTNIGGNCFRRTGAVDMKFGLDLVQSASFKNADQEQPLDNYVEWATDEEVKEYNQIPDSLRLR